MLQNKKAIDVYVTTGEQAKRKGSADRDAIMSDGKDLSFITIKVVDNDGCMVSLADNLIKFSIEGPGEFVVTDNGDPSSFVPFNSNERKAFNGLALVIVRVKPGKQEKIILTAQSDGLSPAKVTLKGL